MATATSPVPPSTTGPCPVQPCVAACPVQPAWVDAHQSCEADGSVGSTSAVEVPVVRWTYHRDGDRLHCDLRLSNDLSAYQLQWSPPVPDVPPAQLFDDAVTALQRQAAIDGRLRDEGWQPAGPTSHRRRI